MSSDAVVEPGGLLAILGGGQLGRMTAMAARSMGYRVRVMDPEAECPASFVVDEVIVGKWDDVAAARRLAAGADAVTIEIEQIGVDALREVAALAPLRPWVEPIRIIQDKILQKEWLDTQGFPVGAFRVARTEAELAEAVTVLGGRVFVKTARGGYDGRGQVRLGFDHEATAAEIAQGWADLGGRPVVVEQALELEIEISVMAARSPHAARCGSYPAARNHHAAADIGVERAAGGDSCGSRRGRAGGGSVGLWRGWGSRVWCAWRCLLLLTRAELLVNELAPRPA